MTLASEAAEAADGARRQIATCAASLAALGARLRATPPAFVATCARGSSDHAATYGKYLLETTVGRIVASVGPSVVSAYARTPAGLDDVLFVAVSQSGASPDVVRTTEAARRGGALVVGIVNDTASPLAALCDVVVPMCAGAERSVAATKSFLLSGVAFVQLAAAWTGDGELARAVTALPDALDAACRVDWGPLLAPLARATDLYVVGRGVGLGAAAEIALKLKETCRLHAEAFSAAEVLHGPVALVGPGFPILVLGQDDETAAGTRDIAARLAGFGASVLSAPRVAGVPPVVAPLCQVQSFYLALTGLAAARGFDADTPPHLNKITETV